MASNEKIPADALPAEEQLLTDEELMRRMARPWAKAHEIEADMEVLVGRYARKMQRYFLRRGVGMTDADDLVQELFLGLLRQRAKYDPEREFLPWLHLLARNIWITSGRRRETASRALFGYAQAQQAAEESAAGDPLSNAEELQGLRTALEALPEDDRELLRLARFEGLSYAQIATVFGSTPGAIKVRASRALEKLRQYMR